MTVVCFHLAVCKHVAVTIPASHFNQRLSCYHHQFHIDDVDFNSFLLIFLITRQI